MRTLALQDVLIAMALRNGTLTIKSSLNRFGDMFWFIYGDGDLIQACKSQAEADDAVAKVAESLLA